MNGAVWRRQALGCLIWGGLSSAWGVENLDGAWRDSRIYGFGKTMYVADDKKGGRRDQSTFGFGGKLGLETADVQGGSLRLAWYQVSDLGLRHDDPRRTDAYMFDINKRPFGLLGEAQIRYLKGRTQFNLGRQELVTPMINSYDYRIVPNLFEAYVLQSRDWPDTLLTVGYVSRMAGLDGLVSFSQFRSMAQQLYPSLALDRKGAVDTAGGSLFDVSTVSGQQGVWMAGFEYGQDERYRLWDFHGQDTVNMLYMDTRWQWPLTSEFSGILETQFYRVGAQGELHRYLGQRGLNASYDLRGVRATLAHAPSGIKLAYAIDRFGGNDRMVTVFSSWGGYPEFVPMPYIYAERDRVSGIAGSRLSRLTALFNLAPLGWAGHTLLLGRSHIDLDEAILANGDIKVNSLLYRAQLDRQWSLRISFDCRQSRNSRYDNKFAVFALRYDY
ncbi:MAG: hypothetical protein D3M94_19635 [Rhodocyclales bacterium GT-UBC]|nr:MAG: hypothetical protein D3M94_19635 [Rhodocyclales bacterium GT-UBC]